MNKKILIISFLAVIMMVTISYATAVNTTDIENKESPLYRIRIQNIVKENIGRIVENLKIKLVGERMFFLPLQRIIDPAMYSMYGKGKATCSQNGACLPTSM
jgi:hypothetical protein